MNSSRTTLAKQLEIRMADSTTGKRDASKLKDESEEKETISDSQKRLRSADHVSSSCTDSVSGVHISSGPDPDAAYEVASSSSQCLKPASIAEDEGTSSCSTSSSGMLSDACLATLPSHTVTCKAESLIEVEHQGGMGEGGVESLSSEEDEAEGAGDRQEPLSSKRSQKSQVLVGLKETDVGIIEYMSDHEGVSGILKQRYRDFLVNEIDEEGRIIRLTDTKCPEQKSILPFDHNKVLTKDDQEKLSALNVGQDKKAEYTFQVTDDKEQRTKVHQAIRHLFPKLDSSTVEDGGKKMVKVVKGGGGKRGRWPKEKPKYCRFVLYKENMDLNEALNIISKYLHIGPHHFQYAGSKDKRGVTVQEVTAHRIDGERLAQLNRVLRCIRLGNFRYVHKPLNLGELSGNHFVIVLRMMKGSQEQINHAMSSLRDVGFVNYFGMQRFGNSLISTYHVGRALLLNQWQTAVDLILKPRDGAQDDNKWREHWMKTRDAKGTLEMLPHHKKSSVEQQLLRGLLKTRNDYQASFSSIPRNTRLIYLHSYQSYIWNVITSQRLQKDGLKPVVGDLVSKDIKDDEDLVLPWVEYVTEENQDEFTIYDVVLPLPGHGVKYPTHQAGEWYTHELAKDDLTVEMLKNPNRDLSLSGAYRKCVVRPTNVSWELYTYSDAKIPLVLTDLEKLENKPQPELLSDGTHSALKVEFSLPSSCYATMALREVMKTDTSAVHQSTLNR